MATTGGARALHLRDVGRIAPGMRADLAVFDLRGSVYAAAADPLDALIFSSYDHRASLVMVEGRVVVEDGEVRTVDEHDVLEQAAEVRYRLVERNAELSALARAQQPFLGRVSATAPPTRPVVAFCPRRE